jgi:hypothetical protein
MSCDTPCEQDYFVFKKKRDVSFLGYTFEHIET